MALTVVLANVDQAYASTERRADYAAVTIQAPHEWDGIGQALRAAYGSHREAPSDISGILRQLENVD